MAITFMIIDFDKEPGFENKDILDYLGYVEDVAGQENLSFFPHMWRMDFSNLSFKVHGIVYKLLSNEFDLPYITIAFVNAIPVEKKYDTAFVDERSFQMAAILKWLMTDAQLDFRLDNHVVHYSEVDIVYKVTTDLTSMYDELAKVRRGGMSIVKGD